MKLYLLPFFGFIVVSLSSCDWTRLDDPSTGFALEDVLTITQTDYNDTLNIDGLDTKKFTINLGNLAQPSELEVTTNYGRFLESGTATYKTTLTGKSIVLTLVSTKTFPDRIVINAKVSTYQNQLVLDSAKKFKRVYPDKFIPLSCGADTCHFDSTTTEIRIAAQNKAGTDSTTLAAVTNGTLVDVAFVRFGADSVTASDLVLPRQVFVNEGFLKLPLQVRNKKSKGRFQLKLTSKGNENAPAILTFSVNR